MIRKSKGWPLNKAKTHSLIAFGLVGFLVFWLLGLWIVIGPSILMQLDGRTEVSKESASRGRVLYQQQLGTYETRPLPSAVPSRILVLIHTTPVHISRALGVAETWGGGVRTIFVLPQVCQVEDPARMEMVHAVLKQYSYLNMDVRFLSGIEHCYEYPPVHPWLRSLQVVESYRFKWLLKCDDDVYVNVRRLLPFLDGLEETACKTAPCYFGSVGYGRKHELRLLGLNGHPFVMGGPCVVLSSSAYKGVRPLLSSCMVEPALRAHSDTQLGRCFLRANVSAGLPTLRVEALNQLFKQYYPTVRRLEGESIEPFAGTTVPRKLHSEDHSRLSLHTIKTREEMHLVHAQLQWRAKPLFAGGSQDDLNCAFHDAVEGSGIPLVGQYPHGSEVASGHEVEHWQKFPSCRIPPPIHNQFTVCMVYIISLNATSKHVNQLQVNLVPIFKHVTVWPAVDGREREYNNSKRTQGENGLKESYSAVFRHALAGKFQNILVLEEDALLRLDFGEWWKRAIVSDCLHNAHMDKDIVGTELLRNSPGIVLLGGTVYGNDVWSVIDEQVSTEELLGLDENVHCFDLPPGVYGAFAVLYNTRLLHAVLNWIETYDEPFDWIWGFLSAQGFSVKALAPFLAIMELNKESTVASRAGMTVPERQQLHRWNPSLYMQYVL